MKIFFLLLLFFSFLNRLFVQVIGTGGCLQQAKAWEFQKKPLCDVGGRPVKNAERHPVPCTENAQGLQGLCVSVESSNYRRTHIFSPIHTNIVLYTHFKEEKNARNIAVHFIKVATKNTMHDSPQSACKGSRFHKSPVRGVQHIGDRGKERSGGVHTLPFIQILPHVHSPLQYASFIIPREETWPSSLTLQHRIICFDTFIIICRRKTLAQMPPPIKRDKESR